MRTLSQQQIDQFVDVGYVNIDQAFLRETVDRCRTQLWQAIDLKPDKPATWTQPLIRVGEMGTESIRLPVADPAGATGWHADASFPGDDPLNYLGASTFTHRVGRC